MSPITVTQNSILFILIEPPTSYAARRYPPQNSILFILIVPRVKRPLWTVLCSKFHSVYINSVVGEPVANIIYTQNSILFILIGISIRQERVVFDSKFHSVYINRKNGWCGRTWKTGSKFHSVYINRSMRFLLLNMMNTQNSILFILIVSQAPQVMLVHMPQNSILFILIVSQVIMIATFFSTQNSILFILIANGVVSFVYAMASKFHSVYINRQASFVNNLPLVSQNSILFILIGLTGYCERVAGAASKFHSVYINSIWKKWECEWVKSQNFILFILIVRRILALTGTLYAQNSILFILIVLTLINHHAFENLKIPFCLY